jgi:indolepyruvate ferredoxin oxidoreductase alpha subunit
MGNEAIGLGALAAGVRVVTGYPGTPSSEILPTVSARNPGNIHVEWSVNEKVALEVAAGAAMAGARSMVTMKQVGLNVAADPLMSLAYLGVKGGMVVVVADDPGPISSQTEQDTRTFGLFSKLPVFDPATPEEAYEMVIDAFELSERHGTPVLFRPTTRVCHGNAPVSLRETVVPAGPVRFVKDPRWVIFPRLSYQNHIRIEQRLPVIADEFSGYRFNSLAGAGKLGIVTQGISTGYVGEALAILGERGELPAHKLLRVATPHPFPKRLALDFLDGLERVLVIEELDPYLERELQRLAGERHLPVTMLGKASGHIQVAGENTVAATTQAIAGFLGLPPPASAGGAAMPAAPELPARPPVLCAGCSHRNSYLAVKRSMRKRRAIFSGDIGCYTLGNAEPLNMVDTCLCMGAGINMAQGLRRVQPDAVHFAFIGDSTFFHSGITGVINAVYNRTPIVVVVLDNSTTAMTGLQPHPGTGDTMMGELSPKIDIATVLRGIGVGHVEKCDPMKLDEAEAAVVRAVEATAHGVAALIFESPCIHVCPPGEAYVVDAEACKCKECIIKLGCPAILSVEGKAWIDNSLCHGCDLCLQICRFDAIRRVSRLELKR